jgi:hypothetical protein
MEHNKSPRPIGFPAEFYQIFWDMIKRDLMALFIEFHKGSLPLFSLNFGTIILLPKCAEALKIHQYWPICLLNASFKIFTKALTNHLNSIAHKVIQPTQNAFLPVGIFWKVWWCSMKPFTRCIGKKQSGVIFKIDFKKAYDKVKWLFVRKVLEMKGFSYQWCNWIDSIMQRDHVGVKINDLVGQNF